MTVCSLFPGLAALWAGPGMPRARRGKNLWGAGPGAGFGNPEALAAFDGASRRGRAIPGRTK